MSKRKQKKLESLRRRLKILDLRIESYTNERKRLVMQAGMISAEIACADMPPWKRNVLIQSACPTNLSPRPPVSN